MTAILLATMIVVGTLATYTLGYVIHIMYNAILDDRLPIKRAAVMVLSLAVTMSGGTFVLGSLQSPSGYYWWGIAAIVAFALRFIPPLIGTTRQVRDELFK